MDGFEMSLAPLEDMVDDFEAALMEAQGVAQESLLDATSQAARDNPRWVGLADYIDTWDEEDRFWIGVRGPRFVSEAFMAEYGSEEYPPAPLLRTMDRAARQASMYASEYLEIRLPYAKGAHL